MEKQKKNLVNYCWKCLANMEFSKDSKGDFRCSKCAEELDNVEIVDKKEQHARWASSENIRYHTFCSCGCKKKFAFCEACEEINIIEKDDYVFECKFCGKFSEFDSSSEEFCLCKKEVQCPICCHFLEIYEEDEEFQCDRCTEIFQIDEDGDILSEGKFVVQCLNCRKSFLIANEAQEFECDLCKQKFLIGERGDIFPFEE